MIREMRMINAESYKYERRLGFYDDGGTGSDMRRYAVWNGKDKREERFATEHGADERLKSLTKEPTP